MTETTSAASARTAPAGPFSLDRLSLPSLDGLWASARKGRSSFLDLLVVSIETPGVETDIWTPVAQQVSMPVEIVS